MTPGRSLAELSRPALTADAIVIAGAGADARVLLIRRGNEPFAGRWALPGGFVDEYEQLEAAARRELAEETGLQVGALEQLHAYDTPGRDPRGWVVSIAFIARVGEAASVAGGDDADEARWFALDALPALAFDHDRVLADLASYLAAARGA
jgi:8-oxo-dGTP diphosphatase